MSLHKLFAAEDRPDANAPRPARDDGDPEDPGRRRDLDEERGSQRADHAHVRDRGSGRPALCFYCSLVVLLALKVFSRVLEVQGCYFWGLRDYMVNIAPLLTVRPRLSQGIRWSACNQQKPSGDDTLVRHGDKLPYHQR